VSIVVVIVVVVVAGLAVALAVPCVHPTTCTRDMVKNAAILFILI
jgi:hypothetical protein